jgi:hypothetical protein
MPKPKTITLDRVANGFLVRWKAIPSQADPDPEERVHICADLEIALQMVCDEISLEAQECYVSLLDKPDSERREE